MSKHVRTPAYRLHKARGLAVVTIDGHDHYLGRYGSPESREKYDRLIAEWLANGRKLPSRQPIVAAPQIFMVSELVLLYYEHAQTYYRKPNGKPTNEVDNLRIVLGRLRRLYGSTPAAAFDSLALETLRDGMIRDGLARGRINRDVSRIKRTFRWAASKKLVPVDVHQQLATLEGLRAGRSQAKETEPVRPIAEDVVEATLPFLRPQPRAMVQLQLLTGLRPGEVIVMRTIDLDTSGPIWFYRPGSDQGPHGDHKTAWRGHDRLIAIGPKAQGVLKPWLRLNVAEYLFQPREARASFDADRRARRRSKVYPCEAKRRPKRNPKKKPGDCYTGSSYIGAIHRACDRAGVPRWSPNRLRHSFATEVRRGFGLDAAQVALGHQHAAVSEIYAEKNKDLAARVALGLG